MKSSSIITHIEFNSKPFPYFFSKKVFDEKTAEDLLNLLKHNPKWKLHKGNFFEQFECFLQRDEKYSILYDKNIIKVIKHKMQMIFKKEFDDKIEIVGHKMVPGQSIEIHNDNPNDENETHRLIIQLNEGFKDSSGGDLIFFNSNNSKDIYRAFPPIHNTAIGMEFSKKSHHAVTKISYGNRYTIIYSFWNKAQKETTK